MLIFHHDDLDGRCSAAIMAAWCKLIDEQPEFIEIGYKDPVPLERISGRIAIVDFSFKPEIMEKIRERTTEIIWCDHHKTAEHYGYDDLPGRRDFTNKGLSGCECTWLYCFVGEPIPAAVKLIGDYDSWRLETEPACFEFFEGMKLEDTHPTSELWKSLLSIQYMPIIDQIKDKGRSAIQYRDNYCADMLKAYGYETKIAGHKAIALNIYRFGSSQFGQAFYKYPICLAYIHDGKKFTVSLYSDEINVGKIAESFGGGGHRGAAGFVCETLPFSPA